MLLYKDEHLSCFNYGNDGNPSLEILRRGVGESFGGEITETMFVFFISGLCRLSYGEYNNMDVPGGRVVLFPPGTYYGVSVKEEAHIVMLKVRDIIQLCECMSIERLFAESSSERAAAGSLPSEPSKPSEQSAPGMLEIIEDVDLFITDMCKHFGRGLKCSYYLQTKTREFLFLLRAYYDKDSLAAFFAPMASSNAQFTLFVYRNYRKVKNLQELIAISSYSESTFKKIFTKLFGIPASIWLRKQKAELVFHELNANRLSIKQISHKYYFSSVSSFNTFCLRNFGQPPGKIRKTT